MDPYKETFNTWNKIASLYQDRFMDLDLYDTTYDEICQTLTQDKAKILEIGSGPGNITRYLLSKRPDFDIFGIDVAPNMVELAKKNNPSARFAILDCRQIDEFKTKYDGIICGFCLPYLSQSDCNKLIADCRYLLNEGGLIYLSFVEGDPDSSHFQTGSSGDRVFFHYHHLADLKKLLAASGFEEQKIFKVEYKRSEGQSEMHTIWVGRKKVIQHHKN